MCGHGVIAVIGWVADSGGIRALGPGGRRIGQDPGSASIEARSAPGLGEDLNRQIGYACPPFGDEADAGKSSTFAERVGSGPCVALPAIAVFWLI